MRKVYDELKMIIKKNIDFCIKKNTNNKLILLGIINITNRHYNCNRKKK